MRLSVFCWLGIHRPRKACQVLAGCLVCRRCGSHSLRGRTRLARHGGDVPAGDIS